MYSEYSSAAVARRRIHIFVCVHMKCTHTEWRFVVVLKECVENTYTECSFVAVFNEWIENTYTECIFVAVFKECVEKTYTSWM